MKKVYIGAGGNLGDVVSALTAAFEQLKKNPSVNSVILSSFYRSKPLSDTEQPAYINAVALLETTLSPMALLAELQNIEQQFGRVRTDYQWASRTIDLDILLYENLQLNTEKLTIPHVGIMQRDFVLYPMYELTPTLNIVGHGSLISAMEACENRGLEKLNDNNC